jgi:uncharacterized LabA/DUF88 family protein
MAKLSLDVEEIKSALKTQALNAKAHLTDFAKLAQKDLSERGVLKKVDQIVEIVKSQEFMKNPRVAELAKKIAEYSEQIEKIVTKNANQWVDEVRSRVTKASKTAEKAAAPVAKKAKKAAAEAQSSKD